MSILLEMQMETHHKALLTVCNELVKVQQRVTELEQFIKSQPKIFYEGDKVPAFLQDENC